MMSVTTTAPRTRIRFPGPRATDARIAVTITEPATPFPITVYFVLVGDDERPGVTALVNVGFEVGKRFDDRAEGPRDRMPTDRLPRPLDRQAVEAVISRFRAYVEYARATVEVGMTGLTPGTKPSGRRRELTDDFLSMIADQYEAWSAGTGRAVTEISKAHGVNRSTASRWVEAARARGLLPQKGSSDAS